MECTVNTYIGHCISLKFRYNVGIYVCTTCFSHCQLDGSVSSGSESKSV